MKKNTRLGFFVFMLMTLTLLFSSMTFAAEPVSKNLCSEKASCGLVSQKVLKAGSCCADSLMNILNGSSKDASCGTKAVCTKAPAATKAAVESGKKCTDSKSCAADKNCTTSKNCADSKACAAGKCCADSKSCTADKNCTDSKKCTACTKGTDCVKSNGCTNCAEVNLSGKNTTGLVKGVTTLQWPSCIKDIPWLSKYLNAGTCKIQTVPAKPATPTAPTTPTTPATPGEKPADSNNNTPATGSGTGTGTAPVQGLTADEQKMVDLVNKERTAAGLPALKVDMTLVKTARMKSQDMIDKNYFSHTSPTYGSPFDLMKSQGVTYKTAGENLAGNQTVEKAHTALMNSSGHRANIMNKNYTHIGIGIIDGGPYGKMFTQHFIG